MKLAPIFVLGILASGVVLLSAFVPTDGSVDNPYNDDAFVSYYLDGLGSLQPKAAFPAQERLLDVIAPTRNLVFSADAGLGALWQSTIPVRDRDVLHSLTYQNLYEEEPTVSATAFANLLSHRTFIFKDILNPAIVESAVDNTEIINEIGNISFAQEQIGVLLHGYYDYKNIGFSADLPVMVVVTHPWAPSSTLKMIAAMPSDETFFTFDQQDAIKKQISDLGWVAGLGDLKLGVRVNNSLCDGKLFWSFGGNLFLPLQSGAAAKRALTFNPIVDDFNPSLFDLSFDELDRFKYVNRLISLLKALGANPSLGQKNYGFGLSAAVQVKIHSTCTGYGSAHINYIMPISEYRIIHRYLDAGNTQLAVEPGEYLVKSSRGIILRGTVGFDQKMSKNIAFGLGGDLFFQNKESIVPVFTEGENSSKLFGKDNQCLRAAEMGQSAQTFVYAQIIKKLAMRGGKAHLSLRGSGTLDASGIGKLWNVGVCFSSTF